MSGLDTPGDRFAAFVAHELRTPVAVALALAEAALADPGADTRAWRALGEEILATCEQQQRLIEALLDLTRSQGALARQQPVDLAATAQRALQAEELVELECLVSLEPAVTSGDLTLLERLAANLVSNAIRHNVPRGRIEIATRTDAGRARLSVANTGPLIATQELSGLFEPFAQRDPQPRGDPRGQGLGLGLAIVRSIARAHHATVAARARAGGGLHIEVDFLPA